MTMNDLAMTCGIIPVRHSSLPGIVKLPKRFEKAALGSPRTARHRKVSVCAGALNTQETIGGRMDDLMTAVMWVKQELILLRQHDILLKRQFFDIRDSIQSLQPTTPQPISSTDHGHVTSSFTTCSVPSSPAQTRTFMSSHAERLLDPPSRAFRLTSTTDPDTDSEDFFEDEYYRPRTSSMRTSRDYASIARRRGSKEVI
ncbi:uncharacterized protein LOC131934005 [Physella acuta]|uniref:uncharacterized protein LOC131934005 n=1 Tax=Physella acuta TaxID=109671 RepID=UPI0027DE17B9|nr:uncharacterized protein LOC131934005 [Physella acuta]